MNTRYGRSDWTWTSGLLVPNQALYQTEPHPVSVHAKQHATKRTTKKKGYMHWNTKIIAEAEELVKRFVQNNFYSYLKSTVKKSKGEPSAYREERCKKIQFLCRKAAEMLDKDSSAWYHNKNWSKGDGRGAAGCCGLSCDASGSSLGTGWAGKECCVDVGKWAKPLIFQRFTASMEAFAISSRIIDLWGMFF